MAILVKKVTFLEFSAHFLVKNERKYLIFWHYVHMQKLNHTVQISSSSWGLLIQKIVFLEKFLNMFLDNVQRVAHPKFDFNLIKIGGDIAYLLKKLTRFCGFNGQFLA